MGLRAETLRGPGLDGPWALRALLRILVLALAAALGVVPCEAGVRKVDDPDWAALWEELQEPVALGERARLVGQFEAWIGSGSRSRPFEVSLARAALGLDGGLEQPEEGWPALAPAAAWVAHRFAPTEEAREMYLLQSLQEGGPASSLGARLQAGFEAFVTAERTYRLDWGTALATDLHARAGAVWSAFCLEGILRRGGRLEGAARVLVTTGRQADRVPRAEVAGRRAIVSRGAGALEEAAGHLGAVIACGGADGPQMLGIQALLEGRSTVAARHFGALLADAPGPTASTPPWAQRGFGVALLPARD